MARFVNESECFFLPKRAILAFILKDFYEIDADEREAISSWLRFSIEQKMTRGCSITIAKGNKLIARNYELTVACSFTLIMKGPPIHFIKNMLETNLAKICSVRPDVFGKLTSVTQWQCDEIWLNFTTLEQF